MKNKLSKFSVITVVLVMAFLATLWFLPMWRIDLRAPQYPDGISLRIWFNDVKGDVDIINGLNHYIGMKTIHKQDFPEFIYLPIMISAIIAFGFGLLFVRRRVLFFIWTGAFMIISLFSFYDFYKWEYNYGHDLNPHAPIKVPGMAYQPPLIGYKKMLNFEVLSQPDVGGWFYLGAGALLALACFLEWKRMRKTI